MNKTMRILVLAVIVGVALFATSAAEATPTTYTCSDGYSVTADCGEQCLTVDCINHTWSCECCS